MTPNATRPVRYLRRVIRIPAEASPNVRLAQAEIAAGREPSHRELVPGVVSWEEYTDRRRRWDRVLQSIGLDARFYKGAELLLFPPDWLNLSHAADRGMRGKWRDPKLPRAIGCDPGEDVAETALYVVDTLGILEERAAVINDSTTIADWIADCMRRWNVPPERVVVDRGGGGWGVKNDLKRRYNVTVRTVGFGEAVVPDPRSGMATVGQRVEEREMRYVALNRRCQMYGDLRSVIDPARADERGQQRLPFALPEECVELRRQLALIPLQRDAEGRLRLPPKNRRSPNSPERSLTDIIGHSPDRADALVLALHGLLHREHKRKARAVG